jgi:hypothetical protein
MPPQDPPRRPLRNFAQGEVAISFGTLDELNSLLDRLRRHRALKL